MDQLQTSKKDAFNIFFLLCNIQATYKNIDSLPGIQYKARAQARSELMVGRESVRMSRQKDFRSQLFKSK